MIEMTNHLRMQKRHGTMQDLSLKITCLQTWIKALLWFYNILKFSRKTLLVILLLQKKLIYLFPGLPYFVKFEGISMIEYS